MLRNATSKSVAHDVRRRRLDGALGNNLMGHISVYTMSCDYKSMSKDIRWCSERRPGRESTLQFHSPKHVPRSNRRRQCGCSNKLQQLKSHSYKRAILYDPLVLALRLRTVNLLTPATLTTKRV